MLTHMYCPATAAMAAAATLPLPCTAVDPGNAVCLCHRGRALLEMQQHVAAHADLRRALDILQEGSGGKPLAGQGHQLAHMELNGTYWQMRIQGLVESTAAHDG